MSTDRIEINVVVKIPLESMTVLNDDQRKALLIGIADVLSAQARRPAAIADGKGDEDAKR